MNLPDQETAIFLAAQKEISNCLVCISRQLDFLVKYFTPALNPSGSTTLSVGVTSTKIFDQNPYRAVAIIVNNSVNDISLSFLSSATLNAGIILKANGGVIVLGKKTDIPYNGIVTGIAGVASNVTITEINEEQ